jgi:hypothetical protein
MSLKRSKRQALRSRGRLGPIRGLRDSRQVVTLSKIINRPLLKPTLAGQVAPKTSAEHASIPETLPVPQKPPCPP